jgi:hypothetical protein
VFGRALDRGRAAQLAPRVHELHGVDQVATPVALVAARVLRSPAPRRRVPHPIRDWVRARGARTDATTPTDLILTQGACPLDVAVGQKAVRHRGAQFRTPLNNRARDRTHRWSFSHHSCSTAFGKRCPRAFSLRKMSWAMLCARSTSSARGRAVPQGRASRTGSAAGWLCGQTGRTRYQTTGRCPGAAHGTCRRSLGTTRPLAAPDATVPALGPCAGQAGEGVDPTLVSVAVPYSSVPQMYSVL